MGKRKATLQSRLQREQTDNAQALFKLNSSTHTYNAQCMRGERAGVLPNPTEPGTPTQLKFTLSVLTGSSLCFLLCARKNPPASPHCRDTHMQTTRALIFSTRDAQLKACDILSFWSLAWNHKFPGGEWGGGGQLNAARIPFCPRPIHKLYPARAASCARTYHTRSNPRDDSCASLRSAQFSTDDSAHV